MRLLSVDNGFTLIELSVYMSIFIVLITTIFMFLSKTEKYIFKESLKADKFIRTTLAIDLLNRDLMSASPNRNTWDSENFIFKKVVLDKLYRKIETFVSWQILKGGLCRIEGFYDFSTKSWGKRTISLVDPNIKEIMLEVSCDNNNLVQFANVLLKLNDTNIKKKIYLQNRVICL